MPSYLYKAADNSGKAVSGTMIAEDELNLANKLGNMGYIFISAKPISDSSRSSSKIPDMKPKEALDFTVQLATLLEAGVSLSQALPDMAKDAKTEHIRRITENVCQMVESGTSLRDALALHPGSFSRLYLAIVGAGESTGKLATCLTDLATLLDWQLELKAKMKEAATYPIIIAIVMVGVVLILVLKVIPTFAPIFKTAGVKLPLPTLIVLGVSSAVQSYWYVFLGFVIACFATLKIAGSNPQGKYALDSVKLKLPVVGDLIRKVCLSRFTHTFSLSLKAGVSVLLALDIAGEVIGNVRMEKSLVRVKAMINVGEKMVVAFQSVSDFPPLVVRMISVGEQSGTLAQSLERVNLYYDREVLATVRKLFAMMEPLMIIIMGVVVGGIALAIFLPLFQLSQMAG